MDVSVVAFLPNQKKMLRLTLKPSQFSLSARRQNVEILTKTAGSYRLI